MAETQTEKSVEIQEVLDKMADIVKSAGGFSNVGMGSEYWELQKKYLELKNQVAPVAEPPADPKRSEKDTLQFQLNQILAQYGGLESNVPQHSEYWWLKNRYRALP